ncbi:MAG TPA: hypothetical protein DCO75_11360 [Fibrobacteres bacterium]|nr:hypothetical protein [Fibrobacterota bacterium]
MDEKRKFRRRSLVYNFKVMDMATGASVGRLANLSPEGLMLITTDRMMNNPEMKLSIVLPEKISGKNCIECKAKCMWCKSAVNSDFFEAGFQLTEIPDEDLAAIVIVITKYRLLD